MRLWSELNGVLILSWCWLVYFCIDNQCYLSRVLDGSLWFVCFFFFNFLWGGAVFTVEYKSNVYVFEHPNILSDILQWF